MLIKDSDAASATTEAVRAYALNVLDIDFNIIEIILYLCAMSDFSYSFLRNYK